MIAVDLDAVTGGDLREQLTAVRDELAERLATTTRADAVGPIGRLLVDVLVKIDDLPDDARGSVTDGLQDELAKLRSQRVAGSTTADGGAEAASI